MKARTEAVASLQKSEHTDLPSEILGGATRIQRLHVKAKNIGTVPTWHADAGENAWMDFDEIIVK
jgi:hypothetical protein